MKNSKQPLVEALRRLRKITSKHHVKTYATIIHLKKLEQGIELVATDGFVLVVATIDGVGFYNGPDTVNLTTDAVDGIIKVKAPDTLVCANDFVSYGGFSWPVSNATFPKYAAVTAPREPSSRDHLIVTPSIILKALAPFSDVNRPLSFCMSDDHRAISSFMHDGVRYMVLFTLAEPA